MCASHVVDQLQPVVVGQGCLRAPSPPHSTKRDAKMFLCSRCEGWLRTEGRQNSAHYDTVLRADEGWRSCAHCYILCTSRINGHRRDDKPPTHMSEHTCSCEIYFCSNVMLKKVLITFVMLHKFRCYASLDTRKFANFFWFLFVMLYKLHFFICYAWQVHVLCFTFELLCFELKHNKKKYDELPLLCFKEHEHQSITKKNN